MFAVSYQHFFVVVVETVHTVYTANCFIKYMVTTRLYRVPPLCWNVICITSQAISYPYRVSYSAEMLFVFHAKFITIKRVTKQQFITSYLHNIWPSLYDCSSAWMWLTSFQCMKALEWDLWVASFPYMRALEWDMYL